MRRWSPLFGAVSCTRAPHRACSAPAARGGATASHLNLSGVDPFRAFKGRRIPRSQLPGYVPLSTSHPVFGLQRGTAAPPPPAADRKLLSTEHPAFGTRRTFSTAECFSGPVTVAGFFLAVDPNMAAGARDRMNPNAQLTVRDAEGNMARMRYACLLVSEGGLKLEALIRFQVGWVSPKISFSRVPHVIALGRGFDFSIPYLLHFTMVSVLDERGDSSGSCLYFSGTPLLGFSAGFTRLTGGKLVLNPSREVNPYEAGDEFIGHVHYRQLGFVFFKALGYTACCLACFPAVQRLVQYLIPDPFHRHSENDV